MNSLDEGRELLLYLIFVFYVDRDSVLYNDAVVLLYFSGVCVCVSVFVSAL